MDQCSLGLWCAWFLAFALVSPAESLTVCGGTEEFLDGENVLQFEGCERVNGNLIINQLSTSGDASVPLTYNKLLLLSTIREIDGYLSIDGLNHPQIRDLRFLRRLEVIHGNQTLQLFGQQEYSLVIQNNHHLRTLNLASLRRIENGGVRINSNPSLCLVDTIAVERYLVNSRLLRVGGLGQECTGVYCHEQCEQSGGCWGVIHDECVSCRNYQYMDTCVEFCNRSISYPMETTMQCLPITVTTEAPTPSNSTSMVRRPLPATITDAKSTSSLTPSQKQTTTTNLPSTNLPSTTLSIGSTEGKGTTSPLILSISVVGGTLILSTLGLLVICLLYRQAKKRKKARASLLPKKAKASFLPKKGPEAAPLLIQRCLSESEDSVQLKVEPSGNLSHSTCTIRKSRVSLGLPSSKSEVQGYEHHVGGVDCEPRSNMTPRISMSTPAADVLCSDQNKVVEDATCADFRVTSPADITPRISADSGCYDLDIESHDNHMTTAANHGPRQDARCDDKYLLTVPHFRPSSTSSSHSRSSKGVGVQSAGVQSSEDSTDLEPLFANWKPSLYHPRVSPAMQRPVTMGGVYSTGHHPQHHRNRSYGNNQRGSLTSSHGTGTSTRTSAMTSRSTSQQAGSLGGGSGITGSTMVCGSEVVGSIGSISGSLGFGQEMSWASVRQSKTSSQ